jgi:hypothetical protein
MFHPKEPSKEEAVNLALATLQAAEYFVAHAESMRAQAQRELDAARAAIRAEHEGRSDAE